MPKAGSAGAGRLQPVCPGTKGGAVVEEIRVTAIVVAAGSSTRMGFDKLFYPLKGLPVLEHSIRALEAHPQISQIVLVAGANLEKVQQLAQNRKKPTVVVPGGATRAASVRCGLEKAEEDYIAIHDGARPFVTEQIITDAIQGAVRTGGAAPAVPVKDTVKQVRDHLVTATPDRSTLWAAQTPQVFRRQLYLQALQTVKDDTVTDDCQLLERAGMPVELTAGSYENYKITTPDDLKEEKQMRIGHGYDVHRLVEGRRLILGGVDIPWEKGLLGHSDADVLAHAVMDALLGAAALGDIGKHFPDTDPAYKGADSLQLARKVAELLAAEGWRIGNVDATILCQAPKLAPHIPAMRRNLADALGIEPDQMSVKATTEEKLGFTGEGKGIAVHAVALLEK